MGVRALAVYGLPIGGLPIGGLPIGLMASGALIERIGYPTTITASATVGLAFTLLIGVRWRHAMWRTLPLPMGRGQGEGLQGEGLQGEGIRR